MSAPDVGLVARAQGVATHLLPRPVLESLAESPDVPGLARGLARLGAQLDAVGDAPDIAAIEQAIRRTAARHLRTLARWQRRHPDVLDVFWADQDRRSLRAMLRGAAQGTPIAVRLTGLLPTPLLPEQALTALAGQASPLAVVRQLRLLGYPGAADMLPAVRKAQPEVFGLEVALLRVTARRMSETSRRGGHMLRRFVAERIDVGNAQNALLLAGTPHDTDPGEAFVEGGRWLPLAAFAKAAGAASPQEALATLTGILANTPLAATLPVVASDASDVERRFLAGMLARLRDKSRLDPMGSARLLAVLLGIDAQSRDLGAIAWGAALGTPPAMRKRHLVTPWR